MLGACTGACTIMLRLAAMVTCTLLLAHAAHAHAEQGGGAQAQQEVTAGQARLGGRGKPHVVFALVGPNPPQP